MIAAGFDSEPAAAQPNPPRRSERSRRAARAEANDESSRPLTAVETPAEAAVAAPAAGVGEGEFGEAISNPPLEARMVDPAFDGVDDDDLDIPEFLR